MNLEIIEENIKENVKEKQKKDKKNSKLLQAFENNLKLSSMDLHNKFDSFEAWEYTRSQRLLYETTLPIDKKYKRFRRGSIIKVDFGVNIGSEFSEQHFAITLSKKDGIYDNTVIVVPLTSKKHKKSVNLGKLISDSYLKSLQEKVDKLQEEMQEIDIEKCEFNPEYISEFKEVKKVLNYYKSIKDNFSYACIDQIRTISKLNVLPPMNKYDIVGNYKCSKEIMNEIDKQIIKTYTAIDYREFENNINKLQSNEE